MAEEHQLHPVVGQISSLIVADESVPHLPDQAVEEATRLLKSVTSEQRQSVARDLVALALRADQLAQAGAATLIVQLYLLAGEVVVDHVQTMEMFAAGGIDLEKAAAAMEVEQSKTPVSSSSLQEGKSVMALRLGMGKK